MCWRMEEGVYRRIQQALEDSSNPAHCSNSSSSGSDEGAAKAEAAGMADQASPTQRPRMLSEYDDVSNRR